MAYGKVLFLCPKFRLLLSGVCNSGIRPFLLIVDHVLCIFLGQLEELPNCCSAVFSQLLSTQNMRYRKLQDIIEAENVLSSILGKHPEKIIRAESLYASNLPEVADTGIPTGMLLRRPDIKQAELELNAAHFDVIAA